MQRQYLAHIIRTLEDLLRKATGNEMFRIICSPVDENSRNIGIARAQYFPKRYFAIYYHPKTDEKQLRVLLAHELGHLFLVELMSTTFDKRYDETTMAEPASTILGIFTILDKNNFYHNRITPFKHQTPDDVIGDFNHLLNRDSKKYNS